MEYKRILSKFNKLSVKEQSDNKDVIVEAFKLFWDSNPSEEEFAKYVNGLMLFPKLLYIMCKR